MEKVDYDARLHAVYAAGREMSPEACWTWTDAFARHLPSTLFVQANFADRMPDVWWFRVVPEWRSVDQAQFRPEAAVTTDFTAAGWTLVSHDEVTWPRSASLAEDVEKLRLRAVSAFEHMSDDLVEAGFARIEAALPSLDDGPQYETSELLVFRS